MFNKQEFIKSVYDIKEVPKDELPQIILCGRSNVGKSTFINSLFNRKDLAKTSSTPGKTRSLNFYLIDEKFYLVDLPGFGYAKTSQKERAFWGHLMQEYILNVKNIVMAIHLIDSRHKPTPLDLDLNALLTSAELPYIVLLSKADKLKQSEKAEAKNNIKSIFPQLTFNENAIFHSSVKKTGKKEVLSLIWEIVNH
jgi:GTP-binding protein